MSILIKLKKITDLILLPKTLLKSLYKKQGVKTIKNFINLLCSKYDCYIVTSNATCPTTKFMKTLRQELVIHTRSQKKGSSSVRLIMADNYTTKASVHIHSTTHANTNFYVLHMQMCATKRTMIHSLPAICLHYSRETHSLFFSLYQ